MWDSKEFDILYVCLKRFKIYISIVKLYMRPRAVTIYLIV